jgi:two-component system CheB/CheR fusion protein
MPYRTFEDKIDGLVITFINITQTKRMEEALKDSQTKLKTLIALMPVGIIGLSADGTIMEFNPEAEKISGYKYEEIKGKNYFDIFMNKASRNREEEAMRELSAGETPGTYENFIEFKDGREFAVKWAAFKTLNEPQKLYGIIQTQTNATSTSKK